MATILIVDNDVALLSRMGGLLEQAGYDTLRTSEVVQAEEMLAAHEPDMMLLEVKTSRDTGWQLLDRVAPLCPVIVISAEGREEDVVRGLEAGAVDYIAKPYRSAELLARVRLRLTLAPPRPVLVPPDELPPDPNTIEEPDPAELDAVPLTATPPPAPRANATPVFMSETEEMALLRAAGNSAPEQPATAAPAEDVLPPDGDSLGSRLRLERQRRRITLVQAENDLHIRMWYLQAMEEEKFTLLPRGQMASQMLRTYAQYLGLNTSEIMAEYQRHYSTNMMETPMAFRVDRPFRVPRWIIMLVAVVLALAVSGTAIFLFDPEGVTALGENLRALVPVETGTVETPTTAPEPTAEPAPEPTTAPTREPTNRTHHDTHPCANRHTIAATDDTAIV
ncbi:MAG: response regulator [Chloroflexaceae bacterium]|nr:response regulator [Chloroflexaceae bacterium]